jgi:acetyltransferase-like isoleucine patch superfamily enzyme
MSFLNKLDSFIANSLGNIKLFYSKLLCGNNLKAGRNLRLKSSSRINIWNKDGAISIGDVFSMGYNSELYTWSGELKIGNFTSINDNCKLYGNISIGSNCLLASNIFISSGQHNFKHSPTLPIKIQDKLETIDKSITIEDDCWLGFGVVIMPGIYVGKGAIIGANAVVTKDVFPYTVNGGAPCREIGKRIDFANSFLEINSNNPAHWPFFYRGCDYKQFENIETLTKGIQVIDEISVFLLKKTNANRIKITGCCENPIEFEIFLNKELYVETEISRGNFELKLDFINGNFHRSSRFTELSNDIKSRFNVIEVKVGGRSLKEKYKWEVTSIGMI